MLVKNLINNKIITLIEGIGVTKIYDNYHDFSTGVSDISLKISAGDMIGIYGPEGSGKTTLMRILAGLEKPDVGEVLIKGEPFYEFSNAERTFLRLKKIGLIPEANLGLASLSVLENVALPRLCAGEGEKESLEKANDILNKVGFSGDRNKSFVKARRYQKKLAHLARSLIIDPWVIFIDDPYVGLTTLETDNLSNLFNKINEEFKVAMVVAISDPIYLKEVDKILLIDSGKLIDFSAKDSPMQRLKKAVEYLDLMQAQNQNEKVETI